MELRCLLGHDFGEREVERERREAGDEVVVVYRTVENCGRCGERRIVTENKEVRSIDAVGDGGRDGASVDGDARETADGRTPGGAAATDDGPGSLADGTADEGTVGGGTGDSLVEAAEAVGTPGNGGETDDAVIIGGGGSEGNGTVDGGDGSGTADGSDPAATAGDDGADAADAGPEPDAGTDAGVAPEGGVELLDGDDGDGGSDGDGNWPTPDPDAADEGYDATPHDDTGTDVDFGGGLAPTAEDPADGEDPDSAFVRPERTVASRDADGPTELCCPNCGATRTAAGSSLRGGDICPDCRKGYVAERTAEE